MGSTPDTSGQNEAALMQAQLSKEQLEWAKQIYAENAPAREAAAARANELSDLQMDYMRQSMGQAQEGIDRYNRLYAPVEDSLVADAKAWDTEGRREQEAGKAITDVRTQFNAAQNQQDANLKSMGVNPSDGRYANMAQQMTTSQALAEATAANQARQNVTTQAWARKMDVAALGKGVVSNQATMANMASSAGGNALNASSAALGAANNGQGEMNAAYGGARQGWSSAGSIYGNIAQQQNAANASETAGIGAGIGAIALVI
ncbi:hypothetical protein CCO03_16900 [Comamonas serinivorans]|uniref:Uncharacterized protein n=1 Tax=Comamonas serinivorans TaxID=1082851 RepID=A0A1Y0ERC6_9BURK|nr:hypothetical protein [Comamonas serinivorans]ARU06126.1 hypothetical protein CCO03_16900 [Comamonas serinivorans]